MLRVLWDTHRIPAFAGINSCSMKSPSVRRRTEHRVACVLAGRVLPSDRLCTNTGSSRRGSRELSIAAKKKC